MAVEKVFSVKVEGVKGSIDSLDKLALSITKNREETKRLQGLQKVAFNEMQKGTKGGAEAYEKLTKQVSANQREGKELSRVNTQLNKTLTQQNKEQRATVGSMEALRAKTSQLKIEANSLNTETDKGKARFEELRKEIDKNAREIRDFDRALSGSDTLVGEYSLGIINATKKLEEQKRELDQAVGALRKHGNAVKGDKEETKRWKEELNKTEAQLEQVNGQLKSTGQIAKSNPFGGLADSLTSGGVGGLSLPGGIGEMVGKLGGLAKAAGPYGIAAGAIVGATAAATVAMIDLSEEVNKANSAVKQLFNIPDEEIRSLSAGVTATAETFEQDFNEVLRTANTLSKEFGISGEEALEKINDGFLNGLDTNGEFLESIREYGTQFKAGGFEADAFFSVIQQSNRQGIFSDKGIDVVKEFGLRIREQASSTKDSLNDAFGAEFTGKLFDNINNGSITTQDALEQVAIKMKDTTIPANKLQTVIADTFGGAGEDAGLAFIQNLSNIGDGIDELRQKGDVYTEGQREILEVNQRIEVAQQQLVSAFGFTGKEISGLTGKLKAFALEVGVKVVNFIIDFVNGFRELQNESAAFRGTLSAASLSLKFLFELAGVGIKNLIKGFSIVGEVIKQVFTDPLNFSALGKTISDGIKSIGTNFTEPFKKLAENAKDEIAKILSPTEILKPLDKVEIFAKVGEKVGKVLGDGIAKGIADAVEKRVTAPELAKSIDLKKIASDAFGGELITDPISSSNGVTPEDQTEIDSNKAKALQEQSDNLEIAKQSAAALGSLFQAQSNAKLNTLQAQKDQELNFAGKNEAQKAEINEKFRKEEARIKTEQFKKNRAASVIQAGIDTAIGILRATPNIPLQILAGITGAIQTAAIIAAPVPKFAMGGIATDGGNVPQSGGMITGRSHAAGGVKFNMGGGIGEADGQKGEAYIVNTKHSPYIKEMASRLNVMGGGKAFAGNPSKFNHGGIVSAAKPNVSAEISSALQGAINEIRVINVASDTAKVANKDVQIRNITSL